MVFGQLIAQIKILILEFNGKSVITKDAKTCPFLPVSYVWVLVMNIMTSNIIMRTESSDLCYFMLSAALSHWECFEFFSQLGNILMDTFFIIKLIGRCMEDFKMDSSVKPVGNIHNEALATAVVPARIKLQRNLKLSLV